MLDWVFFGLAVALGGGGGGAPSDGMAFGVEEEAAAPAFAAEPQTPSGKFTTATEVRPIMDMTKANWVAVREFEEQDLLYVTHIFSWRCGMHQLQVSVNGAPKEVWPLPPCYEGTNAPNAIKTEDGLPYWIFPRGSIETVEVDILYDDLSEDSASFARPEILMP